MTRKFKLREGVFPVTVCGETILVADREARGICPYTLHLVDASVYLFSLIQKNLSEAEIVAETAKHYDVDTDYARKKVSGFIDMLDGYGYLISEGCE